MLVLGRGHAEHVGYVAELAGDPSEIPPIASEIAIDGED